MKPGTLLIRADASVAVGSGHVMRCLALAQGWRSAGGDVVFVLSTATSALEQRLAEEHCRIALVEALPGSREDLQATLELIGSEAPSWILLDGYGFDFAYRRGIDELHPRCLVVDDNGGPVSFSSRLVLNQNVHASAFLYPQTGQETRLLLGPRYALLRIEFTAARRDLTRETLAEGRKVLVTMGGSDPNEFAPRFLPYLLERLGDEAEVCVVVGGSARSALSAELQASFRGRVRVLHDVRNMAELMAWADLAIAGAGTTSWELCCMGLPGIVVEAAENQKLLARRLDSMGVAVNAGPVSGVDCAALAECARSLLADPIRRREMSLRATRLVDGGGVSRVLNLMIPELRLRSAEARDCRMLWEWVNDPMVRAASFSSAPIPWETHQQWFSTQTGSPAARIYVFESAGAEPVGQVRYQIESRRATLSINLAPEFRGRGLGAKVLLRGVEELFNTSAVDTIDAYVKPSNERSLELFRMAGFDENGERTVQGQDAVWFVMKRWGTGD